jgi:sialic acid synthase
MRAVPRVRRVALITIVCLLRFDACSLFTAKHPDVDSILTYPLWLKQCKDAAHDKYNCNLFQRFDARGASSMGGRLVIDDVTIEDEARCYLIAEIGNNHQGDLEYCKKMFVAAKESGASAVKLQKRNNATLYTAAMLASPYAGQNSYGPTYGAHRDFLEFDKSQYIELIHFANDINITFFATAFDFESADLLAELDMPAFKVASGDLCNIPLLRHIARFGRPMIISTGGGKLDDVRRAFHSVMSINEQLCILQCTSGYPAEHRELNLRVIATFRQEFPSAVIGLSSHDEGTAMSLVAYGVGARVIEKHFTLDRALKGTDHEFSLDPSDFRYLSDQLGLAAVALGDGVKRRYPSEEKPLHKMSKKLVAARDLRKDDVLRSEDVAIRSPGDGLAPYHLDQLIGKSLTRSLVVDEGITFDDVRSLVPAKREFA